MLPQPDSHQIQVITELLGRVGHDASGMLGRVHDYLQANPEQLDKLKIAESVAIRRLTSWLIDTILRSNSRLAKAGEEPISGKDLQAIPADVGDSFIRESQFVEDERLREMWASLLSSYVRSARQGEIARKAFSSILGQLSSFDAECLDKIYAVDSSLRSSEARLPEEIAGKPEPPRGDYLYASTPISTVLLPERAFQYSAERKAETPEMEQGLNIDLLATLGNLNRLGLIEIHGYMNNGSDPRIVYHTGFGLTFAKAVNFAIEP